MAGKGGFKPRAALAQKMFAGFLKVFLKKMKMDCKFFSLVFAGLLAFSAFGLALSVDSYGWFKASGNGTVNSTIWYGSISVVGSNTTTVIIDDKAIVRTSGAGSKVILKNGFVKYTGFGSLNTSGTRDSDGYIYANVSGNVVNFVASGWWYSVNAKGTGTYWTSTGRKVGWPVFSATGSGSVKFRGTGWTSLNGSGSISAAGRGLATISSIDPSTSSLLVSNYATVSAVGGTSKAVGSKILYSNFSAANVSILPPLAKGTLEVNGSGIVFYAEGFGSLRASGTGSVAADGNKSKGSWNKTQYPIATSKNWAGNGALNASGNGSIRLSSFYGVFNASAKSGSIKISPLSLYGAFPTVTTGGTGNVTKLWDGSRIYSGFGWIKVDSRKYGANALLTGSSLVFNATSYSGKIRLTGTGAYSNEKGVSGKWPKEEAVATS